MNYIRLMTIRYRLTFTILLAALLAGGNAHAEGVKVHGNVYGGGNLADVQVNTAVNISAGTIEGNVFGGGKGKADNFTCDKAMVGIVDDGVTLVSGEGENAIYNLLDGGTSVTITNGTVEGNVYGGGEVGRIERNTIVTIGIEGDDQSEPIIEGHVYGAGKGVETHGYSALVRGNSTVTIQGKAEVWQNVHGGGEKASTGRYQVAITPELAAQYNVSMGMPCYLKAGGKCTVIIQDGVTIGKDADTGDVYGAGQGVTPVYTYSAAPDYNDRMNNSKRMVNHIAYESGTGVGHNPADEGTTWDYFVDDEGQQDTRYVWEYFTTKDAFLLYVETLGRASETDVVIGGKREAGNITPSTEAPTVKGSVFGGSESGFVYHGTEVNIPNGTVNGDAFGGGKGLVSFSEAGRVRRNTKLTVSGGSVDGNVYGGGKLGDVGNITKNFTNYNHTWKQKDGSTANEAGNNDITGTNNNTGICTVTISDGTIGSNSTPDADHGNVFGAGKGLDDTWWCEKAMVFATNVTISGNAVVNSNVYGGGEIGRVEDDVKVIIGTPGGTDTPDITGSVFGAGKGKVTHGYSALVRGNADVTVQGSATVGISVYGGGEIATVGRYVVVGGVPTEPDGGGVCSVKVKDDADIAEDVFGAGQGVNPSTYSSSGPNRSKRMMVYDSERDRDGGPFEWDYITTYDPSYEGTKYVWEYFTRAQFTAFLETLALASHAEVTIGGNTAVKGSVYGGSELGFLQRHTKVTVEDNCVIGTTNGTTDVDGYVYGGGKGVDGYDAGGRVSGYTEVNINGGTMHGSVYGGGENGYVKGGVNVDMTDGTVNHDVYGGGALADTNTGNGSDFIAVPENPSNPEDAGLYEKEYISAGSGTAEAGITYYEYTGGKYVVTSVTVDVTSVSGLYVVNYTSTSDETAAANKTYFTDIHPTTVSLTGGLIKGDAYGGGLGQKQGFNGAMSNIAATVYGDIEVTLDGTAFDITKYTDAGYTDVVKSGRVFGCNNLLGSPQGNVTVTVNRTVSLNTDGTVKDKPTKKTNTYELAAVYGGGNLAPYTTTGKKTHVIIHGCGDTSIETVYGGGNAAAVPKTDVEVYSAYEIGSLFGGGNGKDKYKNDSGWQTNPGADVNGNTNTLIYGGTVHEAYGGSNEKGTVTGNVSIDVSQTNPDNCTLDVGKIVGAGKNADVNGDLIMTMGCKPSTRIPYIYAGADNANIKGDVELTITSGNFGQIFGGNNEGGAIFGHIKLNIEETGGCETPITIEELYLGGNMAAYSQYGYYNAGTAETPVYVPITSASDSNAALYFGDGTSNDHTKAPYAEPELNVISCTYIGEVFGGGYGSDATLYGNPIVNINMIPGSFANNTTVGVPAKMGALSLPNTENTGLLGIIGDVYGGGNAANVIGNPTVNIGTAEAVEMNTEPAYLGLGNYTYDSGTEKYTVSTGIGAYITGNVFGGGKLADVGQYDVVNDHVDVAGNTYVNIGAKYNTTTEKWESVDEGTSKLLIAGNVFGGGKGEAAESGAGAFKCAKAIVTGGTNIHIGNGTVNGTVYGGGEVGRVEGNSVVAIGIGPGVTSGTPTSAPLVLGNVFGAGKGKKTHGYSALLRGNPVVTIEGDAKVRGSVYGGGEIASVGKYNVKKGPNNPVGAPDDVLVGMPYSLANSGSGYCTVIVQGNAEIGPATEMSMTKTGGPDNTGHVFGAGKGVLPYDGYGVTNDDWVGDPWRVSINDEQDIFNSSSSYGANYEREYFKYIETLALATETNVTIGGNAFVKGSVYGGSQNGRVQHDTHVNIAGGQIGQGEGVTKGRYSTEDWTSTSLAECPHWNYVATSGAPYDPLATTEGAYVYTNYDFVPGPNRKTDSDGGRPVAKDGHTYYGNVFGGGSGVLPYAPGLWHRGAGAVGGDTYVNITAGHILSSVYGGNEHTDVGTYTKDASGQPTTTPAASDARGKCTVNMTGGTVGVPRTDAEKQAHPLVGNVFGAGKGDQRIFFNTWTNVINTEVNISGNARIYGSVFGGGEDGHVINDAVTNIGNVTTKTGKDENGDEITANENANGLIIGTTGTSYNDGNVFGGGRGFSGEAQTAGTVGGNTRVNINAGSVYGSVYGGGRLASVGTMFEFPTLSNGDPNPAYGQFKEDETGADPKTYGHVTVNISGGTIGNPAATGDDAVHSGNVFGGSMGRLELLNGTRNPIWPKMAQVKETNVNISGTAVVRRSVYGGGELGTVRENAYVTIGGYKTTDADDDGNVAVTTSAGDATHPTTVRRDVYGGGYGSDDRNYTIFTVPELISTNPDTYESHTYAFTPMQFAGCVGKRTYVNVVGGYIRKSVYGGGELASVGIINFRAAELTSGISTDGKVYFHDAVSDKDYYYEHMVKHGNPDTGFALSWPYEFEYVTGYEGATHVKVTGGRLGLITTGGRFGLSEADTDTGFADNGDVYGAGKGEAGDYKDFVFCANVGSTDVVIDHAASDALTAYSGTADLIAGAVYGGGEDGHVMGDAKVTMKSGLIYHSIYGGGSGKGKFTKTLDKTNNVTEVVTDTDPTPPATAPTQTTDTYEASCYSITAGKVFGNTEVEMTGGIVIRNVYGGGNMGSVGKGNYAGGSDDYSTSGYGEKVDGLWSGSGKFSEAFLNSGKCTVKISGGTIGYIDTTDPSNTMYPWNSSASLPYGNVFGGCRGESAPNIVESPRYLYSPEFFLGYVNETSVEIGKADGTGPTILGSVYGGGMDGHVRRNASVTVKGGEIGIPFDNTNKGILGNNPNNIQWLARGNVYGAGSGIGKYKYDFNYDGDYLDIVKYKMSEEKIVTTKEEDFSTSSGSVTRSTEIVIQGGTIHRNVYGGGSLASIGPPRVGTINTDPVLGSPVHWSENRITIEGGNVGDVSGIAEGYGGNVYGASRGDADVDKDRFGTTVQTSILMTGGHVFGNVFGGGDAGKVSYDTNVVIGAPSSPAPGRTTEPDVDSDPDNGMAPTLAQEP